MTDISSVGSLVSFLIYPETEVGVQNPDFPVFENWDAFLVFLFDKDGIEDNNWDSAGVEEENRGTVSAAGTVDLEANIYTRSFGSYHEPQTGDYIILEIDYTFFYGQLPAGFDIDSDTNTMAFTDFTEIIYKPAAPSLDTLTAGDGEITVDVTASAGLPLQ